ncbi:MAG: arylsulfatase [Chloroflexi bacterium]|nr:arylsulfatase [Chloroflexota bacterium]
MPETASRPNILLFHVDNLGMGELGCYGGGVVRGAPTTRIDRFAREGLQLWHYIAEPQCTPSRSALLTGRHAIRSGTHSVPTGGETGGLVAWERTLGDILSDAGYSTACVGKWHLGSEDGRWATDHGFDEFYGPPRSYTECLWPDDPWYDPDRDPACFMLEGRKGEPMRTLEDERMTQELRRDVDAEYTRRAVPFMRRSVEAGQPFFLYYNHSLLHMPTIPRPEYKGKSGNGDWADCLLELDGDFAHLLDVLDELGVADNTIVIFAGDNGAEDRLLWRGTSGVFEGSYFSSSEGGLRTPCLIRWPGQVQPERISNEMVHQVDLFTTLLGWTGCEVPNDREIDGLDQRAFFEGQQDTSAREGCLVWVRDRLHAIKWQNFKIWYVRQRYFDEPAETLTNPYLMNLLVDPKEREPHNDRHLHSWVSAHTRPLVKGFNDSVAREPVIPFGAPLDYVPTRTV